MSRVDRHSCSPAARRHRLALDRRRHLGLAGRRARHHVRPGGLAGRFVVQDARAARRVPADDPALCHASRRPSRATTSRCTLYKVTLPDGSTQVLAEVRRIGIVAQMVDPEAPRRYDQGQHARPRARAQNRLRHRELHRAVRPFRLPALSAQLGLRDGDGDADHAAHQFDGGLRAVEIQVPRPRPSSCC